jgi:predicted acylesterase/phospholipase RssA
MIEHLVIAGGGTLTLRTLGSLNYFLDNNIIDINNIKTIFGTSAGAIMAVFLASKIDINLITNYFINRPWEDLYDITPQSLYNLYSNKGIFNKEMFAKLIEPLLEYNQISLNITLEDFYKLTNIEIHMFSLELNELEIVDISHITFPDLALIDALYMTSCIPLIFEPFLYKDVFYVDAGIVVNYPLIYCIEYLTRMEIYDETKIFGFNTHQETNDKSITDTIQESNMIGYSFLMFKKLLRKSKPLPKPTILNTITYYTNEDTFTSLLESFSCQEKRKEYINEGKKIASEYQFNTVLTN